MKIFSSIFFLILSILSHAQIGIIDPTYNVGTGSDIYVTYISMQPDQKVIASGNFTSFNGFPRQNIVRLNVDGSVDSSFNPQIALTSKTIGVTVVQNDGKIIIAGIYANSKGYIARLNSDGTIDNTFTPPINELNFYNAIVLNSDGKILVAGEVYTTNGSTFKNVARLNTDGTFDVTFNPAKTGTNNRATSIKIVANNKIMIGGYFSTYNNIARKGIARLNEDGSLDETFNPGLGANSSIYGINELEDGKIIIGGFFTSYNGISKNHIAKINQDGSLDTSFNPVFNENGANVIETKTLSNGKILVTGNFNNVNGVTKNHVVILNSDGSLESTNPDTSFDNPVNICLKQNDGKLVCGGFFSMYGTSDSKGVVRIIPNDLLSTSAVSENKIQINPNPTYDFLNIKTSKLDIENIFIHDLTGKLIFTGKSKRINVSQLPSATYIISIKTSEGLKSFKFIKQ